MVRKYFLTPLLLFPFILSQFIYAYDSNSSNWSLVHRRNQNWSMIKSHISSNSFPLDSFLVTWDQSQLQLSIVNKRDPTTILWQTNAGRAFALAANGTEDVSQWRGSFTISDKAGNMKCTQQTIDQVSYMGDQLVFSGILSGENCMTRYQLFFEAKSLKRLGFRLAIENSKLNRTFLYYSSHKEESFFGFGEQFTYLNLKGRVVPILSQEQGHLRGRQPFTFFVNKVSPGSGGDWHTTYASIPQYISSERRGLFLENYEHSIFNLERPDEVEIRVWSSELKGQIFSGDSLLDLITSYTEYAGRMLPLPDWFHKGAIVGIMGGTEAVNSIHEELSARHTPIAAYWLQDWVGKRDTGFGIRMWWNWQLDRNTYPDWENIVSNFKSEGIRVLGYINPFLSDSSEKPEVRNLFAEAKEKGYLTKWQDGSPAEIDSGGFTGTLVDLSNPEARTWLKQIIRKNMIDQGMSGWMADFGEALPFNAQIFSGESASSFHNRYPEEWAKINKEVIDEAGLSGEIVPFLRSAYTKSPGYSNMFWLGDQMVTWDMHDGLKSSITGLLSGGFSGMSLNHGDIGGLIGLKRNIAGIQFVNFSRTPELLSRWTEFAAFTPAFRTHEGNTPGSNFQFYSTSDAIDNFSYFAKVFALLYEYRKTVFKQAYELGYPAVRHPLLHYPNDSEVQSLSYQFMLGEDLMAAPVVDKGAKVKKLYLPAGHWIHIWSEEAFHLETGKWITIDAPTGKPPIFIRNSNALLAKFVQDLKNI